MKNKPLFQILALAFLLCAVLIPVGLAIHWFPPLASTAAHKVHTLYDVLIIVSTPVFAAVGSIVLYSIWKFRMKPGQELEDGPPLHGNTRLEIIWTATPAIVILALCLYSYVLLNQIEKKPSRELVVDVTGQQFAWSYSYPKQTGIAKPIAETTLYLPEGESVKFRLHAKDVIHDFWVPSFSMKEDAVPGQVSTYRITPDRLGTYPAACLELCGLGHSTMRSTVHVVTAAQFTSWVASKGSAPPAAAKPAAGAAAKPSAPAAAKPAAPAAAKPAAPAAAKPAAGAAAKPAAPAAAPSTTSTPAPAPASTNAAPTPSAALIAQGKQAFAGIGGCGGCHKLADAGTDGTTGPDLDRFLKGKSSSFILASIVKPNAVVEKGYPADVMPQNFAQQLSATQIDGLVAYLAQVTR